jgi:hypothetical protein
MTPVIASDDLGLRWQSGSGDTALGGVEGWRRFSKIPASQTHAVFPGSIFMGRPIYAMVDSLENLKHHRRMREIVKRKLRSNLC